MMPEFYVPLQDADVFCMRPCCVERRERARAWKELIDLYRLILRVRTGERRVYGREK